MLVANILICLGLFFAAVVCMALSTGKTMALWLDTEDGRTGRWRFNKAWHAIQAYRRQNPNGNEHLKIWALKTGGFACFATLFGYLFFLAAQS